MSYDAFISYSHTADRKLAPAVQETLKRLGKPWYRRRILHVFRDETSLAAESDLTDAICTALLHSRFFLYMASPEAARSKWVGAEIDMWLGQNPSETLLIVVTDGEIEWDNEREDFNWPQSTALHPRLESAFKAMPLWVDLRWARHIKSFSSRDPRFQRAVAMLAAPIHGTTLDELVGEDIRQHRRTRITVGSTILVLTLLLGASLTAAFVATKTGQTLESKLNLINTVLPVFREDETYHYKKDNSSLIDWIYANFDASDLAVTESEEWIDWGPDYLATKGDCLLYQQEKRFYGLDCPASIEAFDQEGLRNDIPGLRAMLDEIIAHLKTPRQMFPTNVEKEHREKAEKNQRHLAAYIERLSVLISRPMWDKLSNGYFKNIIKDRPKTDEYFNLYFNIWRKSLENAELIGLNFVDRMVCGSGGCALRQIFFIHSDGLYYIVLESRNSGEFIIYDTGKNNMPQILEINMSQSGAGYQLRYITRYEFYNSCTCYYPYLKGEIESNSPSFWGNEVPTYFIKLDSDESSVYKLWSSQ